MFPPKSRYSKHELDKDKEIVERQLGLVDFRMNSNAAAISQVVKDKVA
jgi:hypothetical protein